MELEPKRAAEQVETASSFGSSSGRPPMTESDVAAMIDPAEHNVVFTSLVTGDTDIVGLVAYSIYKQNKYDWLMAFGRYAGRGPNGDEVQSYLWGESTSRRLATYRHLAEATLEGRGLEVPGARPSVGSRTSVSRALSPGTDTATASGTKRQSGRPVLIGAIIVILIVIGLVWFFHGGPAPK